MTPQEQAILQEKCDLIESQSAELDYLRRALNELSAKIGRISASYMSANGWVRQNKDGSISAGEI